MAKAKTITDITYIVEQFREYDDSLRPETWEGLGSDCSYWKLVKNVSEAEKFNYHSDYWGYADTYQEDNVNVIRELKPYVGKTVNLDGMVGKLLGIAIDRQYNSVSHTRVMLEPIQ